KDKFTVWAIDLTAENVVELPEEEVRVIPVEHTSIAKKVIKPRNQKAHKKEMKVQNGHDG
ncbi:hypothetical protein KKJ04_22370, partial [Xenorhabdus bovienii]|nr:hypothetical protein [Xenorhabdus bovienii]